MATAEREQPDRWSDILESLAACIQRFEDGVERWVIGEHAPAPSESGDSPDEDAPENPIRNGRWE